MDACAAEDPPAARRESRGVWLDKEQLLEGRERLLPRLDRLKEAGFNTIYVATQIRGAVMYPGSAVLSQYSEAAQRDPQVLDWLTPAIHQRGMRAEAWTEFGFYAHWKPAGGNDRSRGAILDKRPHLTAIDSEGKDFLQNDWGIFYSLCPSNPESHEILIELYGEVLGRYPFDGISLDRIRYPEADFCHCAYCKEAFRRDCGLELGSAEPEQRPAWLRWRKEQLTHFMERLSKHLRQARPGVRITSAVVPPAMIDGKGQDWPTWLKRGYLDAAMPMLYAKDVTDDLSWIRQRLGQNRRVFVGLDAGKGEKALTQQIAQARSAGFDGVTVWYSGSVDPVLDELKQGLFRVRATSPLYEGAP